ncbi:MAG: glycerophosphodiester phosphodiesterase family protein [Parvularcula sp.]|nr:glycerophosphodiester phosphodiesterase family protein [Parvularcula sp.]
MDASGYVTAAGYLSCLEGRGALVSAHRGGPEPGFPENALETILATLDAVPALIEVDVRETADGVLVLMHDETVDRTTNGSGTVATMSYEELQALRLRDENGKLTSLRIPRLIDVIEAVRGRSVLQLDVKRGVGLRQVAEAIEAADAAHFAAIITYGEGGARAVAEASTRVSVSLDVDKAPRGREPRYVAGVLSRVGLPRERVIGWTGITAAPEEGIYAALGREKIPASVGAIGTVDRRAAEGAQGLYLAFEEAGADILATDRPREAAMELGIEEVAAAADICRIDR